MALVISRRDELRGYFWLDGGGGGGGAPTRVPEFTCDFALKVAQLNCSGESADENN